MLNELDVVPIYNSLSEIINGWFQDLNDLFEYIDELNCYSGLFLVEEVHTKY